MSTSPTVSVGLTLPTGCRIQAEILADDDIRFTFGDPLVNAYIIEGHRTSIKDLFGVAEEVMMLGPGDPALIVREASDASECQQSKNVIGPAPLARRG